MSSDPHSGPAPDVARFATTNWSVVVAAREGDSVQVREALSTLCSAYWYPLYAYIRRHGHNADEAQDLTQEFFARLLERDFLGTVDRDKGRFRSFLLACCKHFLANERDRTRAQKRGGGQPPVSLDFGTAEDRYSLEPAHNVTADKLFERRWVLTLLDHVLGRLHDEYVSKGKGELFEGLRSFLVGEKGTPHSRVAVELGMSEGAVKVAVHRLRQRYRELLREEIARTVDNPEQVDEEIRELFVALGA